MGRARKRRSAWAITLSFALVVGGVFGVVAQRPPTHALTIGELSFQWALAGTAFGPAERAGNEQVGLCALRRALSRSPHVYLAAGRKAGANAWRLTGVVQPDPLAPGALQLGLKARPPAAHQAPLVAFVALAGADGPALDDAAERGVRLLAAMRAVLQAGPPAWRRLLAEDAVDAAESAHQAIASGAPGAGEPVEGAPYEPTQARARGASADPVLAPPSPSARDALSSWAQLQAVALERLVACRTAEARTSLLPLVERGLHPQASAYARELGLRAVGGLVTLEDTAAVLPLIELAQRREPALVLQLVYAIAALGGRHAEGYLVTVGSGHPHPEVRRAAAQAIGEMRTRARRQGETEAEST